MPDLSAPQESPLIPRGYWICRPKPDTSAMVLNTAFPYGNRHGILVEAETAEEAVMKLPAWWQRCMQEGWSELVRLEDTKESRGLPASPSLISTRTNPRCP